VHLQASWIFLNNDVIANAGIVVAGILVQWTNSYLPDLLMGSIITAVEVGGGIKILRGVQTPQQAYLKQLNETKDS
jgi:Co/Zn/Cd efflux system component